MGNRITQSETQLNGKTDQKWNVFKNHMPVKRGYSSIPSNPALRNYLIHSKCDKKLCEGDLDNPSPYALAYNELCQIATGQKDHLSCGRRQASLKRCDPGKPDKKFKWIHRFYRQRDKRRNTEDRSLILNESKTMSTPQDSYQARSEAVSERIPSLLKVNRFCHRASVTSTSSGDCSVDSAEEATREPQQYNNLQTTGSTSHHPGRSVSTGVCPTLDPANLLPPNLSRDCRSSHGDCTDTCPSSHASPLGFKTQEDFKRCYSAFSQGEQYLRSASRASRNLNSRLGLIVFPDGQVQYTAFVRAGAYGSNTAVWLSDIRKRVARPLAGLQRQYKCKIEIGDEPLSYRGSMVHPLVIRGQNQTEIIRCRSALPVYLERQLITSHAVYGASVRIGQ